MTPLNFMIPYGFPLDLTKEILEEKGYTVDEEGFKKSMDVQRETARKSQRSDQLYGGWTLQYIDQIDPSITTEFVGIRPSGMGFQGNGYDYPGRSDGKR